MRYGISVPNFGGFGSTDTPIDLARAAEGSGMVEHSPSPPRPVEEFLSYVAKGPPR